MEKKNVRLVAGIILHYVKVAHQFFYRKNDEWTIQRKILLNWETKNHERLHRFDGKDFPLTCSFNQSELCGNLHHGAL